MSYSISSDSNDDILSNYMSQEQYSDMINNLQTLDEYNEISNYLYDKIYYQIASCPNSLFKKLNIDSKVHFWEFILENCIGIKYIDHVNKIYQFKDKYNN
jgi:hypothetical protein